MQENSSRLLHFANKLPSSKQTDENLRREAGTSSHTWERRQIRQWLGYVIDMIWWKNSMVNTVLHGQGEKDGRRKKGRPVMIWIDSIKPCKA